ncbi:GAF domain-containing sensor histidine kinase [Actinotignum schaalii]|uniref:GAF domain-containing protein n=1 Tax=Actinotignum schaalii FB123-CNA-2 TaxID=883067 RepID=S2WFK0_9ACTO|nr:GAF domain-containing protein [Actinotignum schaalii]EPD26669.1 hypothetical protein HMPREF9237_01295 [Actinotignum schaalii FB123-CNA-2]
MLDTTTVIFNALALTARLDRTQVLENLAGAGLKLTGASSAAVLMFNSAEKVTSIVTLGQPLPAAASLTPTSLDRDLESLGTEDTIMWDRAEAVSAVHDASGITPEPAAGSTPLTAASHRDGLYGPGITNFLTSRLMTGNRVLARVIFFNKPGSFSEADINLIALLARAATIAVENARLYEESNSRAQWLSASRRITIALLQGSDEEEALQLIATEMRRVADADLALIILPSVADTWACEFVAGEVGQDLVGTTFGRDSRARAVAQSGLGRIIDTSTAPPSPNNPLGRFGPLLYAPMAGGDTARGVIILARVRGRAEFDMVDLTMAESVANQAALALELADARYVQAQSAQLEERSRISRDLHDFAIQQLFASGMRLSALRDDLATEDAVADNVLDTLDNAIESIDESVAQIRQIIYSLRGPDTSVPVVSRLRREVSSVTAQLGFTPSLRISVRGEDIDSGTHTEIDDAIGSDISDDVIAVVRECLSNAVRHAHAHTITVTVTVTDRDISVEVADDGVGIGELSRRSGLSNLAARARRHHGTFSIAPGSESGIVVRWRALIDA